MKTDTHFYHISLISSYNKKLFKQNCEENRNTHFIFSNSPPSTENRALCEMMWKKNIVERGRPHLKIWRMRIACWIAKATKTHSEYVTITAIPLQRWLHRTLLNVTIQVRCLSCI
jgi:hypothetical protein